MKALVRNVNMIFISIILLTFYLVFIGISKILMKFIQSIAPEKTLDTYWQDFKKQAWDRKYFESEY